jgi:hypothetical protein
MTGAGTDRVSVPPYTTAVALILRVASHIFVCAANMPGGLTQGEPVFEAWRSLRRTAERCLALRSTRLSEIELERLNITLAFVHDSYHAAARVIGVAAPSGDCPCYVGKIISQLSDVLESPIGDR